MRLWRLVVYRLQGEHTRLRFRRLSPNYDDFLVEHSDAAISLDAYETKFWFQSRDDTHIRGAEVVRAGGSEGGSFRD